MENEVFTRWWFSWKDRRAYEMEMLPEGTAKELGEVKQENTRLRELLNKLVCAISGHIWTSEEFFPVVCLQCGKERV